METGNSSIPSKETKNAAMTCGQKLEYLQRLISLRSKQGSDDVPRRLISRLLCKGVSVRCLNHIKLFVFEIDTFTLGLAKQNSHITYLLIREIAGKSSLNYLNLFVPPVPCVYQVLYE
eukprot:GHVP01006955.1.p1 GENE.GHVP01006955.1~~GHVP01006955.1.p1  ORF type:complete len:118 (-),score=15.12 GHVP01006955.1:168-521(-)